jgi:hypothetical protein
MILIFCRHLLCPFFGGLLVTSFNFSISSTSVISLIKKADRMGFKSKGQKDGSIKMVLINLIYVISYVSNC